MRKSLQVAQRARHNQAQLPTAYFLRFFSLNVGADTIRELLFLDFTCYLVQIENVI